MENSISNMSCLLAQKSRELYERCILDAAEQVLGRPVTAEDGKDFELVFQEELPATTHINYKGQYLGTIAPIEADIFEPEHKIQLGYTFTPANTNPPQT